jgi:hypothetical protein
MDSYGRMARQFFSCSSFDPAASRDKFERVKCAPWGIVTANSFPGARVGRFLDPVQDSDIVAPGQFCNELLQNLLVGPSLGQRTHVAEVPRAEPFDSRKLSWAIANQKAGHPLGLAGPSLYNLPVNAFYDVRPYSSPTNVTGTVSNTKGSTYYSAAQLAGPLENSRKFYSAFWDFGLGAPSSISPSAPIHP